MKGGHAPGPRDWLRGRGTGNGCGIHSSLVFHTGNSFNLPICSQLPLRDLCPGDPISKVKGRKVKDPSQGFSNTTFSVEEGRTMKWSRIVGTWAPKNLELNPSCKSYKL